MKNILFIGNNNTKIGPDYTPMIDVLADNGHSVHFATNIYAAQEQIKKQYQIIILGHLYDNYNYPESYIYEYNENDRAQTLLLNEIFKNRNPGLEKIIISTTASPNDKDIKRRNIHKLGLYKKVETIQEPHPIEDLLKLI